MGLEDKASSSSSGDVVAVVADGDLVEGTKDEASCGDITTAIITTSTPTNTDSVSVDESSLKHSGDQSVSANHTDSDKPVGSDGCIVPASKGEEEGGETSIAPDPLPSPPAADQNPSSPDETAPQSDTPENAEAFPCAAVSDGVEEPNHRLKQAGEHVSCKYTKEKLLERHWGVTIDQMRRVKALLRMGVCEEDLEIADRLIKLGRDVSADTPWTKEEQLLGYTAQQRQRIKALHTLGLTEESFDRCRAIMLSSLGPSAFGFDPEEVAILAGGMVRGKKSKSEDKGRRKTVGGMHGLLKMPSFANHNIFNLTYPGKVDAKHRYHGGIEGTGGMLPTLARDPSPQMSNPDKEVHLPSITAGQKRPAQEKGGGHAENERVQPIEGGEG